MKAIIPQSVRVLLWDVNTKDISSSKHYKFIIERILEYGDIEEIKWMKSVYSKDQVIDTLKNSRRISEKSGNFWGLIYNLNSEELLCLRKPYTQKQNRF